MNILESFIYGLISGLTEFLPISSNGHQTILRVLFGVNKIEPIRQILIKISLLLAILVCCGTYIEKLRRGQKISRNRRSRHVDNSNAYELQIVKAAAVPMIFIMFAKGFVDKAAVNLAFIALFFVINGLIIYIPDHLPQSNKDASKMSGMDGLLMGLLSGLSIFPGISRVGASLSCGIARGADKQKALNWILALSIPAIVVLLIFDFISIFTVGIGVITFQVFLGYLISAIAAFAAACFGIYMMQFILMRSGIAPFGYYCWGMAMLSFILYLTA